MFAVGVWRTEEGHPYTKVVSIYGRLVSSNSDEFKDVCEARSILGRPLNERSREMDIRAGHRGGRDSLRVGRIRAALEACVLKEWKWRKAQREAAQAVAA